MEKTCPKCGTKLEENAIFCDECGERISVAPMPKADNVNSEEVQNQKQSGLGIASFVLGIISMVSLGILFVPEILGIVFGIVGLTNKNSKKSFAIMGITFSAIAILVFVIFLII